MGVLDPVLLHDYTARTNRWLSAPRPRTIKLITIHTTRGGSSDYRTEYLGTISWSQNPANNQGGWGSSEQRVAQGRDIAIIVPDNRMATYGAGYAGLDSLFAVDEYSLNLEIAQMRRDTPIEPLTLDTAARQCAVWCVQYKIPVARIAYLDQSKPLSASGLVGHEDTGNGRILGKTDPGPEFNWKVFLALVDKYVEEELGMGMTPEEAARLAAVETLEAGLVKRDDYIANAGTVISAASSALTSALTLIQAGKSRLAVLDAVIAAAGRVKAQAERVAADIAEGKY